MLSVVFDRSAEMYKMAGLFKKKYLKSPTELLYLSSEIVLPKFFEITER